MPTNVFEINCDALDCDSPLGAAGVQDKYCPKNVKQSQLDSVILVHPTLGTLVTNWGPSLAPTDFDIDNADATDVKQKQFFGVGSIAESEDSEVEINSFQLVNLGSTTTATFTIHNIDSETYDYWRKVKCGTVKPRGYFTTVADEIIGSATAINFSSIKPNIIFDEGKDAVKKIVVVFTWESKTMPDIHDYPL